MNTKLVVGTLIGGLLLICAACVPLTPPASTPAPSDTATEVPAAATDEAIDETLDLSGELTGTVTYLQRVALPAGSVVEVQLQDVSRQDVAATVVASQTITTSGENVPIPFVLNYEPEEIDPRMMYAVRARITVDGELRWTNTSSYAVLTRDAPMTGIEIVVEAVP